VQVDPRDERAEDPVTRVPEHGRIVVEDSLFARLRAATPRLRVMSVTKSTLVATSHLIETLVQENEERCVLVSGFQHGRQWAAERDRYLTLAQEHDLVAVFAGREPVAASCADHVALRLRDGDPLAQEWFVLALGPGLAVTLCGLDGDARSPRARPVREADRVFDVVWSVDPHVAEVAARVVVEALERSAPERAAEVRDRLAAATRRPPTPEEAARATDALLAGLVQRLERTRLQERTALAAASQHKTTFLSRISHELRTPLNAVLGFAQLLELDPLDDDSRESVAQIMAAGRQLVALVDDVLDIGRIEAGELQLDVQRVELGPLVARALSMLAPTCAARQLDVRDETAGAPAVLADPARLLQVLLNLLSNAVKYNRDAGEVVVSVLRTPDAVRLAVRDTGPGMTPAQLERLFTPFERLDAAARGIEGTGLGLVISRRLLAAMDGQLELDSRPHVGTTFVIALPAA
jgi:signal transduction histidine kinase